MNRRKFFMVLGGSAMLAFAARLLEKENRLNGFNTSFYLKPKYSFGFWYKHPKNGWTWLEEEVDVVTDGKRATIKFSYGKFPMLKHVSFDHDFNDGVFIFASKGEHILTNPHLYQIRGKFE